jgi:hypothetical protein
MRSQTRRSVFAAALCAGVVMVGAAVHGMVGVDAELERSAVAAQQLAPEHHSVRVVAPLRQDGTSGCDDNTSPPPRNRHLS